MASQSRGWFPILLVVLVVFVACKLVRQSSPASRVGEKLPPVAVQYLPGSLPYVSGKPAVIEFWATWCPPCRESIPHLNALFARSQGKLQIIGISNEDQATITAFRQRTKMDYSVASDPSNRLHQHFGVRGIPSAVLVDAAGVVKWTGHPMELDDGKIAMLLR
ncbi:MAG TPA: TlpA disulfide reductase family protein [Bacteroidia bacterium]|nr:TlpA disulfide reductase family protein [Bacteroidia bacterium]